MRTDRLGIGGRGSGLSLITRMLWQAGILVVLGAVLGFATNALRPESIPWVHAWSDAPTGGTEGADAIATISLADARRLFESDQAVFLDARSADEFGQGHIKGAKSLPLQEFDQRVESVAPSMAGDKTVITYCDGVGCDLSHELAKALIQMGYAPVKVLINGWSLWVDNDLPAETGDDS